MPMVAVVTLVTVGADDWHSALPPCSIAYKKEFLPPRCDACSKAFPITEGVASQLHTVFIVYSADPGSGIGDRRYPGRTPTSTKMSTPQTLRPGRPPGLGVCGRDGGSADWGLLLPALLFLYGTVLQHKQSYYFRDSSCPGGRMASNMTFQDVDVEAVAELSPEEVEEREVFEVEERGGVEGPLLDFFLGGGQSQVTSTCFYFFSSSQPSCPQGWACEIGANPFWRAASL